MFKIAVLIFNGCWASQFSLIHDLYHIANTLAQDDVYIIPAIEGKFAYLYHENIYLITSRIFKVFA